MAGRKDIAWVADRINAVLQAAWPAKRLADSTLPAIPTHHYSICELRQVPGFPMVSTIPNYTDLMALSGEQRYGIEYHHLTIALALTSTKGEESLRQLSTRTLKAIQQILAADFTLGATVNAVVQLRKEYSPLMVGDSALLQESQLMVRVQTSP